MQISINKNTIIILIIKFYYSNKFNYTNIYNIKIIFQNLLKNIK